MSEIWASGSFKALQVIVVQPRLGSPSWRFQCLLRRGFTCRKGRSLTCFRRQHKSQTALVYTTQGEPTLWKSLTEPKASILLASILTSLILLVGLSLWLAVNLNSPSTFSQTSNLLIAKMRCLWDLIFCIKEAKRPSAQYHYVYLETAHPFLGK